MSNGDILRYPITPALLDALPDQLAELYRELEITLLRLICEQLKTGQINQVTIGDIKALRSHGIDLKEIKKAIQETAHISEQQLNKMLADVIARNQQYYSRVISLADLTQPDHLVNAADIAAIVKQTKGELRNLTRSMAFIVNAGNTALPPEKAFSWACDNAVMQINSGAISPGQAIGNAITQLADSGLKVVSYESGHQDQIDVAIRRCVQTGIVQISDQYTDASADYLDTRYFEISAHSGARDKAYPHEWSSHKSWQGRVYYQSANGEPDPLGKYPDLVARTGYGAVDGLCGANCRHIRNVFIEGVSERTYTDEELANIDPPPFEYQGKTYSHYEATQQQRCIERAIRKWKRREAAYQAADQTQEAQAAAIRLRRLRQEYTAFSKAAGLRPQPERMKVY